MTNHMDMYMDHAVIWAEDMETTTSFLRDVIGFREHPIEFGCSAEDTTTGGMQGRFFDGNGVWLELIKPTSPGPGMDILHKVGAGALVEINFQPRDYDAVLQTMKQRGIGMLNMDGSTLGDDGGIIKEGLGSGEELEHVGQRIAYFPPELTRGTTVEVYEVIPDKEFGLINLRDRQWADQPAAGPDAPWINHISIWVRDLEASASFYTGVLGLQRFGTGSSGGIGGCKSCFIDARGVWLELIQPLGPGALMDMLDEKGDGYLGKTCICVNDLEAFSARMHAKGIQLQRVNDIGYRDGRKAACFPRESSCGMIIEVIEAADALPPRSHAPRWD